MKDDQLIFIISQPRAGSTMLQAVLSNNEYVDTVSEPWLLLPFLSIFKPTVNTSGYNGAYLNIVLSDFLKKKNIEIDFKNGIREFLLNIYASVKSESSIFFLDKTPRYYEIADKIVDYFPNAKIIVLKRNPLDVLESVLRYWNIVSYEDLSEFHRDILFAPKMIQEFIDKQKDNPNVKSVFYEDLIGSNNCNFFDSLFSWLNISFNDKYLEYSNNLKYKGLFGDQASVQKMESPGNDRRDLFDRSDDYWCNFFSGYHSYLGDDFLKTYMDKHYLPLKSINNKKLSTFYQVYIKLFRKEITQLDFVQFKYGIDKAIYVKKKRGNNKATLRTLWRHL